MLSLVAAVLVVGVLGLWVWRRRRRAVYHQHDIWESYAGPHDGERFVIVWDPELMTAEEYAELIVAISKFARSRGSRGIKRIEAEGRLKRVK